MSLDRSARARSLDEQSTDLARDAADQGWAVGPEYREPVGSASRYATRARETFAALVDNLDAGRFSADILGLWESSRGSRTVADWVRLVDACERAGVRLWVHADDRLYDPGRGADRRDILRDAVDNAYSSDQTSARVRRAVVANVAAGRPFGRPPLGYMRQYGPVTRELIGQVPDPDEAPVVREMFERFHAGESVAAIARDLAARGVVGRAGAPISPSGVASTLRRVTYAGRQVHRPNGGPATTHPGSWEPLIDPAMFDEVARRLADPARVTNRPGRAVWWLSMIAECGVCGGPLSVSARAATAVYVCHRAGHVKASQPEVDARVTAVMMAFLTREDIYEHLAGQATDAAELAGVREALAAARRERDELHDAVGRGAVSVAALVRAEPAIVARVARLEEEERGLVAPPALAALLGPREDIASRWEAAPMAARREVARAVLVPELLGAVALDRNPSTRPRDRLPAAQRVRFRRVAPADIAHSDGDM